MIPAFPGSLRGPAFAILAIATTATATASASAADTCSGYSAPVPASIIVATPEMRMPGKAGACGPLTLQAFLARRRAAEAQAAANVPPGASTPPGANEAMMAGRFYMTQDGKRMTADDFDAWMKARGIRVAKGKAPAPTPTPPPAPATTTDDNKP